MPTSDSDREPATRATPHGLIDPSFDALVDHAPRGLVHIGPSGVLRFANAAALEASGADVLRHVADLYACIEPADLPALRDAVDVVHRGGEPERLELRFVRPSGPEPLEVEVWVETIGDGGALLLITDLTDRAALRHELHLRATLDSLTGCHNRESVMTVLARSLKSPGNGVAVVYLDLDGFKQINDEHGHGVGDLVLHSVADRLRETVREHDVVGRLGGDEFLVVLPGVVSPRTARLLADRLADAARHLVTVSGRRIPVDATVGSSWTDQLGASADSLVALADAAMYEAKKRRDSGPGGRSGSERLRALYRAIESGELELHFQPVVDLDHGGIWGAEALLRWRRGDTVIPAAAFIDLAEQSGAIAEIGAWALDELCRSVRSADDAGAGSLRWFVNVSPQELTGDAAEVMATSLQRHGVRPESVVVEVTERANLLDDPRAIRTIQRLADLGVGLALDDFGTGWSSLGMVQDLPLSWLKVDRAFTQGLGATARADGLVAAVLGLARELEMGLIIEGVETDLHRRRLVQLGARFAQGHLFSRALPLDDLLGSMNTLGAT